MGYDQFDFCDLRDFCELSGSFAIALALAIPIPIPIATGNGGGNKDSSTGINISLSLGYATFFLVVGSHPHRFGCRPNPLKPRSSPGSSLASANLPSLFSPKLIQRTSRTFPLSIQGSTSSGPTRYK